MARKERRNSHRYTPTRAEACLCWWEGRQFYSVPARLRNLSTSGALIEVENGRPPAKRVWICLAGRSPAEWAPASVQDEKEDASEAGILRLNFFEPFPYEPFKAAVWGEQEGHRAAPPRSELPPSESTTRSYQGSGSRPAAVSEVDRIRFFLGMGDGPGGAKPDADDDRSASPPSA